MVKFYRWGDFFDFKVQRTGEIGIEEARFSKPDGIKPSLLRTLAPRKLFAIDVAINKNIEVYPPILYCLPIDFYIRGLDKPNKPP